MLAIIRSMSKLTVKDLKKILQDLPDDMLVGKIGHFGEFREMEKYDFAVSQAALIPKGGYWRDADFDHLTQVLSISTPDIGPTPD